MMVGNESRARGELDVQDGHDGHIWMLSSLVFEHMKAWMLFLELESQNQSYFFTSVGSNTTVTTPNLTHIPTFES